MGTELEGPEKVLENVEVRLETELVILNGVLNKELE